MFHGLIIFNLTFGCSGPVVRHEFYANYVGKLYLSAWKVVGEATFEIIGSNTITVTKTGAQVSTDIIQY